MHWQDALAYSSTVLATLGVVGVILSDPLSWYDESERDRPKRKAAGIRAWGLFILGLGLVNDFFTTLLFP